MSSANEEDENKTTSNLFAAGPGLLDRVQSAQMTRYGLKISTSEVTHLLTTAQVEEIKVKREMKRAAFLEAPFNSLSSISDHLGLTGFAGLTGENVAATFSKPLGVIFNVTYEVPLFRLEGVESYRIPVSDDNKEELSPYFDEVGAKLDEVAKRDQVAICHCMAGVSRSATLVLAYLIKYGGLSLESAYQELRSRRFVARPNLNFLRQLSNYEAELYGEEKRSPWASYTLNGITREMPQFIIDNYASNYTFEFMGPEKSGKK